MSDSRLSSSGTFSSQDIANKLLNKPRKMGVSPKIKIRNAANMFRFYAENNYDIELQCIELTKQIENLSLMKNQAPAVLHKTAELDMLCEKYSLKKYNEYRELKLNPEITKQYLLNFIFEIQKIIKKITYKSENYILLLRYLQGEADVLFLQLGLECYNEYHSEKDIRIKHILLNNILGYLNAIVNKTDKIKIQIKEANNEYVLLGFEIKIQDITTEIAQQEEILILRQSKHQSIDEQLSTIAGLNESLAAFYEALGDNEKQLNTLFTAKGYLKQIQLLTTHDRKLLREIDEAIEDARADFEEDEEEENTFRR